MAKYIMTVLCVLGILYEWEEEGLEIMSLKVLTLVLQTIVECI